MVPYRPFDLACKLLHQGLLRRVGEEMLAGQDSVVLCTFCCFSSPSPLLLASFLISSSFISYLFSFLRLVSNYLYSNHLASFHLVSSYFFYHLLPVSYHIVSSHLVLSFTIFDSFSIISSRFVWTRHLTRPLDCPSSRLTLIKQRSRWGNKPAALSSNTNREMSIIQEINFQE